MCSIDILRWSGWMENVLMMYSEVLGAIQDYSLPLNMYEGTTNRKRDFLQLQLEPTLHRFFQFHCPIKTYYLFYLYLSSSIHIHQSNQHILLFKQVCNSSLLLSGYQQSSLAHAMQISIYSYSIIQLKFLTVMLAAGVYRVKKLVSPYSSLY